MTTTDAGIAASGGPDPPVMTSEPFASTVPHKRLRPPRSRRASRAPHPLRSPAPGRARRRAPPTAAAAAAARGTKGSPVFVIGSIGHDFGTEANRDGFITQMPAPRRHGRLPPNPYDPNQLHEFLGAEPWWSDKLIWLSSTRACRSTRSRPSCRSGSTGARRPPQKGAAPARQPGLPSGLRRPQGVPRGTAGPSPRPDDEGSCRGSPSPAGSPIAPSGCSRGRCSRS